MESRLRSITCLGGKVWGGRVSGLRGPRCLRPGQSAALSECAGKTDGLAYGSAAHIRSMDIYPSSLVFAPD